MPLVPDPEAEVAITEDPDDDKFMRCAFAAGAIVVSGDRHLLDAAGWQGVEVVTPADFAARLAT